MYQKISDKVTSVGHGMQILAMTPQEALKIVQQASPQDIQKVLQDQKLRIKEGTSFDEYLKTAAIPGALKALAMALMLLAPAASSSAQGVEELQLKLKSPAQVQMTDIQDAEQAAKADLQQQSKAEIKNLTDMAKKVDKTPGGGTSVGTVADKHYTATNPAQAKLLKEVSLADNHMKALGMSDVERGKTLTPILERGGLLPGK